MIPVNELRIDNYIFFKQFGKGKGKIGQIKPGDFGRVKCDDPEDSEYHPIPLTPEWLERCGFKGVWLEFNHGCQISAHKDGTSIIGGWDSATSNQSVEVPCKYVHQLQNLYFALTGEELEINFNK
jgi:hypothetical protein